MYTQLKTRSAAADALDKVVKGHMKHLQQTGVAKPGTAWGRCVTHT